MQRIDDLPPAAAADTSADDNVGGEEAPDDGVRVFSVERGEVGFGFNVRGQLEEGGIMKAVNGTLYAPLHEVSGLLGGSNAERSGLQTGDKILQINEVGVEGSKHSDVIELLRNSSSPMILTVVRPILQMRKEDVVVNCKEEDHDWDVITIPDFQEAENANETFIVYNVYINGRLSASWRYSQFERILKLLQLRFKALTFPPLPGKKIFGLSTEQLQERRRGLEEFLVSACKLPGVYDSFIMRMFLKKDGRKESHPVPMDVMMPDRSTMGLLVNPKDTTEQVYARITNKLGLRTDVLPYFALFEIMDDNFERKLGCEELPFSVHQRRLEVGSRLGVMLKKWVFSPATEATICTDPLVLSLIFSEAMMRMERKEFSPGDRELEIECLIDSSQRKEAMEVIRTLDSYDQLVFPHCPSDSRKHGHVMCSVSYDGFKIAACSVNGKPEGKSKVRKFDWDEISSYECQMESFTFSFSQGSGSPRTVNIYTPYKLLMKRCFDRVRNERSGHDLS